MTKQGARDWVASELSDLLNQFGDSVSDVSHEWKGDALKFRFRVSRIASFRGALTVTDTDLDLDLPFPLLARGFEGKAKDRVEQWLDENLPKNQLQAE
jgi:hypothetical protein